MNLPLPPAPVMTRVYPWEEYDQALVMQWLYQQALKTGFHGTIEDFKQRYGAFIEATDPEELKDLIENYTGAYHITPLLDIEQILKTKNKVLNQDIIIEPIPDSVINIHQPYNGRYQVTPMAQLDQVLRTNNKYLEEDIVIEKIPYAAVSNNAGGRTVTIG